MPGIEVIASGISVASLAIQIGDSVIKLKDFWGRVKDAPEEIAYLIEEMEVLKLALSNIQTTISSDEHGSSAPPIDSSTASRCLDLCKRGADGLDNAVKDLGAELEKGKRRGGFKTALRKGAIDRLRERLRSAQTLMMLSQQTYSYTLQAHHYALQKQLAEQYQGHITQLTQMNHAVAARLDVVALGEQEQPPETKNLQPRYEKVTKALKRQNRFIACFQTPRWLPVAHRSWELCGYTTRSGWTLTFRTYALLPGSSEASEMVANDDVRGLQQLLREGHISLYSRNPVGLTLLDMAALGHKLDTCQFLLDQGLSPNDSGNYPCESRNGILDECPRKFQIVRHLFVSLEDQDIFNQGRFFGMCSPEVFSWLLRESDPLGLRTLEDKINIIYWIRHVLPISTFANLVRRVFTGSIDSSTATCLLQQLLKNLGDHFGGRLRNIRFEQSSFEEDVAEQLDLTPFKSLVSDLIHAGANLYASVHSRFHTFATSDCTCVNPTGRTPLLELFHRFISGIHTGSLDQIIEYCTKMLTLWIHFLSDANVDLEEYGQKTQYFHLREYKDIGDDRGPYEPPIKFVGFTYGPNIENWTFYLTEDEYPWAAEFWDMIEHPERAMPGAWHDFQARQQETSWNWMLFFKFRPISS